MHHIQHFTLLLVNMLIKSILLFNKNDEYINFATFIF